MKQSIKMVLMAVLLIGTCACDEIFNGKFQEKKEEKEKQEEKIEPQELSFFYSAIITQLKNNSTNFIGIAVGIDNSYLEFNDDANYNNYIIEWANYYWVAYALYKAGINSPQQIDDVLNSIHKMPNTGYVQDEKLAEIVKREYYNNQDIMYYEPTRRYGVHTYPTNKHGGGEFNLGHYNRYIQLKRFASSNYSGHILGDIPNGVLVLEEIHYSR